MWWGHYATLDDVVVIHVNLSSNLNYEARAIEILDDIEQKRALRFESMQGRRQFLLCRSALRVNLCEMIGCKNKHLRFSSERNEKPVAFVNEQPLRYEFNVSHTVDHGMIAFAKEGRVGVDIEHRDVKHDIDGDIRRVFSDAEQLALQSQDGMAKVDSFLRLWTMKEAVIKATGEGFRADTTRFTIPKVLIDNTLKDTHVRFEIHPNVNWQLINLETENFAAAIAHEIL